MSNQSKSPALTLLKRPDVERMTTLSRAQIYALIRADRFPRPIKLSAQSVAWVLSDVEQWIADKITASKDGAL